MAAKRQPDQEGTDDRNIRSPLQDSNQAEIARALSNVLLPLLRMSMTELQSCFEPVIRKVVHEEVPSIIQRHLSNYRTMLNQTERSGVRARSFQLCFMNKLPSAIFTFSKLTAENDAPLEIALRDATSQYAIVTNGPLSSTKIEICPLEGEFDGDDWTANEFNANILRERKNKGPLLNGDKFVILKNGVGTIPEIVFTDNSSWIRSGVFRIGARIVNSAEAINIREARSDPIRVRDSRGEAYKKHVHPSLNDPIWRLKKIAKDGKFHLHFSSHGIGTVKDLLHLHMSNPASFEQICEWGKIPRRSREAIIEHAKASRELDDMCCLYPTEGQPVVPVRELSPSNDFMAIDEPSPNSSMNLLATGLQVQAAAQSSNPDQVLSQPSTSTSHIGEAVDNNQVWTDQQPDWTRMLQNSPIEEYFPLGLHIDGNNACPTAGSHALFSGYLLPSTGNGSYFGSGDGAEIMHHSSSLSKFCGHASSSKGNRKTLWHKIRNALKLVGLYAAKRNLVNPFSIPRNY